MCAFRMIKTAGLVALAMCGLWRGAFAGDSVTWSTFDEGLVTGLSVGTACTGIAGQALTGVASSSANSITGGFFGNATVRTVVVTGVPTGPSGHVRVALLEQNFPNPCRLSTVIRFNLPRPAHVSLKLFSVQGQRQATLVDNDRAGGPNQVDFRIGRIPPGMYFYRLETSETGQSGARFVGTKKLVVLK